MAPCVRESAVKALPETIWKRCIADLKWEEWDEDVVRITTWDGLKEGGKFTFDMKNSSIPHIPCTLIAVEENRRLEYKGSVAYGAIRFHGRIDITKNNASDDDATKPQEVSSHVRYYFNMTGILGAPIYWYSPTAVVHGTETGLANIVKLSEEAAALAD